MAVPPKWGEAILRLAKATERVAAKLDELPAATDGRYVAKARELAKSLIVWMDLRIPTRTRRLTMNRATRT
jgi:hypothetical protein